MKAVKLRKSFIKDYNKLHVGHQRVWAKSLQLFIGFPNHSTLRRHSLLGKYLGLESIDVAPDLRALFIETQECYVFYYLKNHNQLYS